MNEETLKTVDALCKSVMVGFANLIKKANLSSASMNYNIAVAVLRETVKSFVNGESYKNEREAILLRSVSDNYVIGLLAADAFSKYLKRANG